MVFNNAKDDKHRYEQYFTSKVRFLISPLSGDSNDSRGLVLSFSIQKNIVYASLPISLQNVDRDFNLRSGSMSPPDHLSHCLCLAFLLGQGPPALGRREFSVGKNDWIFQSFFSTVNFVLYANGMICCKACHVCCCSYDNDYSNLSGIFNKSSIG